MLVSYEVTDHLHDDVVNGQFVTARDIQMIPGNAARSAELYAVVTLSSKLYIPSFQKHYEGFVTVASVDGYVDIWGTTLTHCRSTKFPGLFKFNIINRYSYPGTGFAILHHHGMFPPALQDVGLAADSMVGEVIVAPPTWADEVTSLLGRSKAVAKLLMELIGELLRS